jgi:hypothetical protein
VPEAVKLNDAVCFFLSIFALMILVCDGRRRVNVAVMAVAEFTVTVQVVPPLQPGPLRLAVDPDAGVAVSVTDAPYG